MSNRWGQLKPGHIVIAAISLILLLVPTIGSVYPVPSAPVKYFPYMFAAYFIAGGIWIAYQNRRLVIASRGFPDAVQDA